MTWSVRFLIDVASDAEGWNVKTTFSAANVPTFGAPDGGTGTVGPQVAAALTALEESWHLPVPVVGPDRQPVQARRHMTQRQYGNFTFPGPPEPHEQCELCSATDFKRIADVSTQIRNRELAAQQDAQSTVEKWGHYLFNCLIGVEHWAKIRKLVEDVRGIVGEPVKNIELALSWAINETALHNLNWEMMKSDESFLAQGFRDRDGNVVTVAITRLVPPAANNADLVGSPIRQLSSPPRMLFVIGTSINEPQIQPGLEVMNILRQFKTQRYGYPLLNSRVLLESYDDELKRLLRQFKPDVVHFICHGNAGGLSLKINQNDTEATLRDANQIQVLLQEAGRLPQIVVLSACESASAARNVGNPGATNDRPGRLLPPSELAPLAARLVQLGIPIVIGMAGRVTDVACRLFTSRCAKALVMGETLASATAQGRRSAFVGVAEQSTQSVDWGFPALFVASSVRPDYVPVQAPATDTGVAQRIGGYKLWKDPPFFGRENIINTFYEMLDYDPALHPEGPNGLAIYTITEDSGYGRTRMLHELAAQGLKEGHFPVLFSPLQREGNLSASGNDVHEPVAIKNLPNRLMSAINAARVAHGLDRQSFSTGYLYFLTGYQSGSAGTMPIGRVKDQIEEQLDHYGRLTAIALGLALLGDLQTLATDLRSALTKELMEKPDDVLRTNELERLKRGRVILLLDDVDEYTDLVANFYDDFLGELRNATFSDPILIIFTYKKTGQGVPLHANLPSWVRDERLDVFDENGESMLAYQSALMNPPSNSARIQHIMSKKAWVIDRHFDPVEVKRWERVFQDNLQGMPGKMASDILYYSARGAQGGFVKLADDGGIERILETQ